MPVMALINTLCWPAAAFMAAVPPEPTGQMLGQPSSQPQSTLIDYPNSITHSLPTSLFQTLVAAILITVVIGHG